MTLRFRLSFRLLYTIFIGLSVGLIGSPTTADQGQVLPAVSKTKTKAVTKKVAVSTTETNATRGHASIPGLKVKPQPARIRIGLRLTPFKKVVTRFQDGTTKVRHVPDTLIRRTLRARLDKTNHFFLGEWHIETKPERWQRESRHYQVRLSLSRRYGALGQLEESVGQVIVRGTLEPQADGVFALFGVGAARLRNKLSEPLVDIVAGFRPGEVGEPTVLSKGPKVRRGPKDSISGPRHSSRPYLKGRF